MERRELITWLNQHPEDVHGQPEAAVRKCEEEVAEHTEEEAWLHARDIAEERNLYWQTAWGAHASEKFVAREVCQELAAELKRKEPVPEDGHEGTYVDEDVLTALEPEARSIVLEYVHDLARGEEHRAWLEVLRFTRERGRSLARDDSYSSDLTFDGTHSYAETAARVMDVLAHDFERRAHTKPR